MRLGFVQIYLVEEERYGVNEAKFEIFCQSDLRGSIVLNG